MARQAFKGRRVAFPCIFFVAAASALPAAPAAQLLSSSALDFGFQNLTSGPGQPQQVIVQNQGTEELLIEELSIFNGGSQVTNFQFVHPDLAPIPPGEIRSFDILMAPAALEYESTFIDFEGYVEATLVAGIILRTNDPLNPAITISLVGVSGNNPPYAEGGSFDLDEDTQLEVGPEFGALASAFDDDTQKSALWTKLDTPPANAAFFEFNRDGSFTYVPQQDFFGEDSFAFTVTDGFGETCCNQIFLTVNPVVDLPLLAGADAEVSGPTNNRTVMVDLLTPTMPDPPEYIDLAEDPAFFLAKSVAYAGQSSVEYTLREPGDGEKRVHVRLRNEAGQSEVQEVTVQLDETPPAQASAAPLALESAAASTPERFEASFTVGFTEPVFTRDAIGRKPGLDSDAIHVGGSAGELSGVTIVVTGGPSPQMLRPNESLLATPEFYRITVSGSASSTGEVEIGLVPGAIEDEAGNALDTNGIAASLQLTSGLNDWQFLE